MKVVIVGSHTLDLSQAVGPLFKELLRLPNDAEILIRKPKYEPIAPFENLVDHLAQTLNHRVYPMIPIGKGREGVWERDMNMIEAADYVMAFFDERHVMEGGTAHVVEKAIEKEVPTSAYRVDEDGHTWIGGTNEENLEASAILAPAWSSPQKLSAM